MHRAHGRKPADILSRHVDRIGVAGRRATDSVTSATQDLLG